MIRVDVTNQQAILAIPAALVRHVVRETLRHEAITRASVSVALVDDRTMRGLHAKFLGKRCTTDVLAFVYQEAADHLDGELVISAETARRVSAQYGHSARRELLLYLIHGALHLAGYRDGTAEARAEMERRQGALLARWSPKASRRKAPGGRSTQRGGPAECRPPRGRKSL